MLFLGAKTMTQAQVKALFDKTKSQEVFAFGTNRSQDGYITGGFMLGEWGVYAGVPYSERNNILNTSNGSVSKDMRFGVMKSLQPNKVIVGVGVQPTYDGTKLHSLIGYNPLKSTDMKLWLLGNITGSTFSIGAGLSYKIK